MANFRDFEYCKVDLIASKGIVFCKYSKTSSALLALETIMANDNMVSSSMTLVYGEESSLFRHAPLSNLGAAHCGQRSAAISLHIETYVSVLLRGLCLWPLYQVAGYKVKCMIAEPKGKRGRIDPSSYDALLSANQVFPAHLSD